MLKKLLLVVAVAMFVFAGSTSAQNLKFTSKLDSVAYVIGQNIGTSLKRDDLKINLDLFKAGVADALYNETSLINMENMQRIMQEFQAEMQAKANQAQQAELQGNKLVGEKFLSENKTKPGVMTTPSGLQYKVNKEGTGAKPKATDKVKVHYEGKLLTGQVFDSSIQRGEPIVFALNQVIPGWTEGVQLMTVGSKYTFWINSDLAYGDQPAGELIGPGSTLVFEVELIDINPKEETK